MSWNPFSRSKRTKQDRTAPKKRWRRDLVLEPLEARLAPSANSPDLLALPLSFEANRGQADAQVQYLAHGQGYSLFLTGADAVLDITAPAPSDNSSPDQMSKPLGAPAPSSVSVVRMQMVGADSAAQVVGLDPLESMSNYFIGDDPTKWLTNVPNYGQVQYQGIYSGIDLTFHGNPTQLQYDFHVAAGADPTQIRLRFQGADQLTIDTDGNLLIQSGGATLVDHAPFLYQTTNGVQQAVDGRFVLLGDNQVGFAIGAYDTSAALVIDPTLVYSSYQGGSGNDQGFGVAVDSSGNIYVAGLTSGAFPTAGSPYQSAFVGASWDSFVMKLNPAGTSRIYSTYVGSTGNDEAFNLAVDAAGNAYITGFTDATTYPTTTTNVSLGTVGAYQTSAGGSGDLFLTKLNSAGSGLLYSTYFGGNGADNAGANVFGGQMLALDGAKAIIAGTTASTNLPTKNAYQTTRNTANDAFVVKIDTTQAGSAGLLYSTYLGGSADDQASGVAVDPSGKIYMTGWTGSSNFPLSANRYQGSLAGSNDVFVTKIDPTLSGAASLVYSTYLGGSGNDQGVAVAADANGNAYVTGLTASNNFPTAAPFQASPGTSANDVFVTKLNPSGTGLLYSTYLGGATNEQPVSIAVDSGGNAVVAGFTASPDFPVVNASQPTLANLSGSNDAFVTRFDATGIPYYSTFLGGNGNDTAGQVAVDNAGNAYVVGYTNSGNFPTVSPVQAAIGGSNDVFVAKLSDSANHAPMLPVIGTQTATKGTTLTVNAGATDADLGSPGAAGAVAWWRGEGNANDSLSGNNGTFVNGAAPTPNGKLGQAFSFDGVNDYVSAPSSSSLNVTAAVTVDAWVNVAVGNASFAGIAGTWDDTTGNNRSYLLALQNNKVKFYVSHTGSDFPSVWGTTVLQPGVWYHVAGTFDGTNLNVYVNGIVDAAPVSSPGGIHANSHPFFIGNADSGPAYFKGSIDETTVFNRALAASEIQAIYNQTNSGLTYTLDSGPAGASISPSGVISWTPPPTDAVSWWKLDGDTSDSAGGNNATLHGPSDYSQGKVNQAFNLDGSNYLQIPDSPSLKPTSISIEAWVKPDFSSRPRIGYDYDTILLKQNNWDAPVAPGDGYALITAMDSTASWPTGFGPNVTVPVGTPVFYITVGGSGYIQLFSDTAIPDDGAFHHVAATYDGTAVKIYLDGVLTGSHAVTGAIRHSTADAFIGYDPTWPALPTSRTSVDDVALFARALSGGEVRATYNAGSNGLGSIGYTETVTVRATDNGFPTDAVSLYPLDGSVADVVGGNNPSATSAVSFVGGKIGQGATFGAGGYIDIPDSASLQNQQFTLSAWVQPVAAGVFGGNGNAIIEKDLNSGSVGSTKMGWDPQTGRFVFVVGDYASQRVFSTNSFSAGQFYHVAGTFDGTTIRLYVNGQLEASLAAPHTVVYDSSIPWTIGNNGPAFRNRVWQGVIDDVNIFNRPLSAAELQAAYKAGSAGKMLSATRTFNIAVNAAPPPAPSTPTPDAAGNALQFDGMNDFVEVPSNPALHDDRNITISGWFKADGYPREWQNIFFRGSENWGPDNNGDVREYGLWLHWGGELHVTSTPVNRVGTGSNTGQVTIFTAPAVTLGQWYHFAVVISADLGVMRLYLNGSLLQEVPYLNAGSNIRQSNAPLLFGTNWQEFQGSLDNVALYHSARTQAQIIAEMNHPWTAAEIAAQPDLAAYWKFDDAGITLHDEGPNHLDGIIATPDSPAWVAAGSQFPGPFPGSGSALLFDGANDIVSVPSPTTLNVTNQFTAEAWVYPTDTAKLHGVIFDQEGEFIAARGTDGYLYYGVPTSVSGPGWNWVNTQVTIPLSKWSHIALTYDGNFIRTYLNGNPVGPATPATGAVFDADTNFNDFRIGGRDPWPEYFPGKIDEVRVWNVARSQADIQAAMSSELQGNETGLIGYWTFDEGAGTIAHDTAAASAATPANGTLTQDMDIGYGVAGALTNDNDPSYQFKSGTVDLNLSQANKTAGAYNTVSFWINWNGWDGQYSIGFNQYALWFNGGQWGFTTGNGDMFGTSSAGLAGQWVHVVASFLNGDVTHSRLWINGTERSLTLSGTPSVRNAGAQARISGWPGDSWNRLYGYTGGYSSVDEVAFFNRLLSQADIDALKANNSATYRSDVLGLGPIAYYRLDESGPSDVVADSSPFHNDGHIGPRPLSVASGAGLYSAPTSITVTVVNTADSGPGSLRQAILDANAQLGYLPVTIQFAIPITDPGYNAATGVFTISPVTALPAVASSRITIDGATQAANIGDTNPGRLGAGGTVGVGGLTLDKVDKPEIQIVDSNNLSIGLDIAAGNTTIRGLAIYGFGNVYVSSNDGNIRIRNDVSGTIIEKNVIGAAATGFSDPGAGLRSGGPDIVSAGADNGVVRNNLIGYSGSFGFFGTPNTTGWLIQDNEIRGNGIEQTSQDGIHIQAGGSGNTIIGNLIADTQGQGVDLRGTGELVTNNTITHNGLGRGETAGVDIWGSSGDTVSRNIISGNWGPAVMVASNSQGNTISQNSIFGNGSVSVPGGGVSGEIGIDLLTDTSLVGTAPFRTLNDNGDGDSGGNGLFNAPVITSARSDGTNLTVTGFARPGSNIEFFTADPDPSGFGEGKTYLASAQAPLPAPFAGSGSALAFNGGNQYVITPNLVSSFNASAPTVTLEVNFNANGPGVIVSELGQSTINTNWHDSQIEVLSTGEVKVRVWNLTSVSLGFVTFGTWHHVALRYDAANTTLVGFLDGVQSAATTTAARQFPSTGGVYYALGTTDGTNLGSGAYFNGEIDEFRVWNTARTQAQIQASMNSTLTGTESGLVAYYRFNEGSGGTAFDLTAHQYHAALGGGLALNRPIWFTPSATAFPTGSYNIPNVGADTAAAFTFVIPLTSLAAGVNPGDALTATATALNGSTSEFSQNVTLKTTDAAPVITSTSITPQIDENGFATLTVNYTDADAADGHTATINWGDGTAVQTVSLTGPTSLLSAPATFGGHTYYVNLTNLTWDQAEAQAQLMGGHLVTINSQTENDFVRDLILDRSGTNRTAYIGMTDADNEGVWSWVSGEPVTYANFLSPGEPNNSGFLQDHAYINFNFPTNVAGFWDDAEGRTNTVFSVIEIGPEKTFTVKHQYKNSGAPTVSITVTDNDIAAKSAAASATITVNNLAPVLGTTYGAATAVQKATPAASDQFGSALAIIDNTLYVGAPFDDTGATNAGAVYAYNATTGAFLGTVIQKNLNAGYTRTANDQFGFALAAVGGKLVIGANLDDFGATDAGAVYVYDPTGNTLTRVANPAPAGNDQFGSTLAAVGGNFVVGAALDDNGAAVDAGAAYIFDGASLALLQTLRKPIITVTDLSGAGRDATLSGTAMRVAGALPNDSDAAYQLTGGQISAGLPLNTASGGFNTVSFWMKSNGGNVQMPIGFGSYDLYFQNGFFGFNSAAGDLYGINESVVADNQWHLITAVFKNFTGADITQNQLWVDGARQALSQLIAAPSTARMVGSVISVAVTNGGSGYTSAPSVAIAAPGNSGASATATAVINNGSVVAVNITFTGSNYTAVPAVSFSGGGGSGATATATIGAAAKISGWSQDTGYHFLGSLDEVAFFNRQLTPTEIGALWTGRTSANYDSVVKNLSGGAPVAYYRLGDGPAGLVDGAGAGDQFGAALAAGANNQVIVGAPQADAGGGDAGAVYIYNAVSGALVRTLVDPFNATLASHNNNFEHFGAAVAGVGNYIVVGAPLTDMDGGDVGW
ncbi:MAG: LamG-like jellyroll fold domain-containing protein, partial [Gemmataceae bacterium]